MSLSSSAFKRLVRELQQLQNSPPEGIRVVVDESDIVGSVVGWIEGPSGTPFEGGYFKVRFQFGPEFPAQPPKCWFGTKIFHPNVAPSTGEICVSTLKKDWKKEYGVGHILITVKCLLIHPNPESALHEEAGKLLLEAYDDYAKHARLVTDVHARHKPAEFTTTASSTSYQPYGSMSNPITSINSLAPSATSTSLPSTKATASYAPIPTPFANSTNSDVQMHDTEIKPSNSSSGSSSTSTTSTTTIPKKRSAPPVAGIPSTTLNLAHQGVLGASSAAGVSSGNTVRKPVSTAGGASAQAPKKRGLKRL